MSQFGTDPKLLARKGDPATSHAAAATVDTTKLEEMVYEAIKAHGAHGCIADQLLTEFSHYPYSSITARFSALVRKGLVNRNGDKRPGRSNRQQLVMRAQ